MSARKIAVAVASVVSLACAVPSAQAGEKLQKEQKVGLFGGMALGAIVGGPVGAILGTMVGGAVGDSASKARVAQEQAAAAGEYSAALEKELTETRLALARESGKAGGDEMFDSLAERLQADVLFKSASSELEPAAQEQLKQLGNLLSTHAQLQVELQGFTDPRGKKEENLALSERRAAAVRNALIAGGASPNNIYTAAMGESQSTAAKGDLEAYAWERHVSLKIHSGASPQVAQAQ